MFASYVRTAALLMHIRDITLVVFATLICTKVWSNKSKLLEYNLKLHPWLQYSRSVAVEVTALGSKPHLVAAALLLEKTPPYHNGLQLSGLSIMS